MPMILISAMNNIQPSFSLFRCRWNYQIRRPAKVNFLDSIENYFKKGTQNTTFLVNEEGGVVVCPFLRSTSFLKTPSSREKINHVSFKIVLLNRTPVTWRNWWKFPPLVPFVLPSCTWSGIIKSSCEERFGAVNWIDVVTRSECHFWRPTSALPVWFIPSPCSSSDDTYAPT